MNAAARHSRVVQRAEELTPDAQLERAKRQIGDGIVAAIKAMFAIESSQSEWVDQNHCAPLTRGMFLSLARAGVFPSARKRGKQTLVLRTDLHAYIEEHGVRLGKPVDRSKAEEVDDILDTIVRGSERR